MNLRYWKDKKLPNTFLNVENDYIMYYAEYESMIFVDLFSF